MRAGETLRVALMTEVFHDAAGPDRLGERLRAARAQGAELAVLPELPLNDWCAVRRTPSPEDAEPLGGPRQQAQARAARESGVALLGGAILQQPGSGRRENTAFLFGPDGEVLARYGKVHLPYEEGFWEADHYEPGDRLTSPVALQGFPVGIQICSDANRPEPCHILGAMGALALLHPRATPPETFPRWRLVLRANAVTSTLYLLSVNRPEEPGSPVGGPSLAIAPDGEVLVETVDPLQVLTLRREVVEAAQTTYPGYLAQRSDLYAQGWAGVAEAAQESLRRRASERGASQVPPIDTNPRHG